LDFNLDYNQITALATSVTAITAVIVVVLRMRDRRTKYFIEGFGEPTDNPQIWKINIGYWNKPIVNCSVFFNDVRLTWDDKLYETTIKEGVSKNLTIPKDIFNIDGEIIVKSEGRSIGKKTTFHKILRDSFKR
jgi:hypothetical protein